MEVLEGPEEVDSLVYKEIIENYKKRREKERRERKRELKGEEEGEKEGIPIEKVEELLPELKIDKKYCSEEEYEYIPDEEIEED
jgi:predicted transposase YdaD